MSEVSNGHGSVERMEFLLTLRRRGISDPAVLRAMDEVPREHFVAADFVDAAYADQALPIACGQTISQPYVVAYMTEQLDVYPAHRVLEIGAGSGYQAAVLSRLAREVVCVERYRTLAETARLRLKTLGYDNVTIVTGDGIAASSRLRALRPHPGDSGRRGRCRSPGRAASAGRDHGGCRSDPHGGPQRIVKLVKTEDGLQRHDLIAVRFVPLLAGQAREL